MRVLLWNLSVLLMAFSGVQPLQPSGLLEEIESHCVVVVVSQEESGELIVTDPVCYPTLEGALAAASHGRLGDDVSSWAEFLSDHGLDVVVSSFTLGTHFDGANGTGSSISIVGTECTGGYWNTGASWANRISSSWNGCYRLRHHDSPGKTGSSADTVGAGTHNLPAAMNNKTESVSYWSS
ncbi:MAG TPA: hypothetical protein VJA46_13060 [Acidimicrobiia bacterium]|nr:hypothetical protein [Acidimicrobiia bacterium]